MEKIIVNLFDHKIVVNKAQTIFERYKGLMFDVKKRMLAFDVDKYLSIHSFFMNYELVLVYFKNNKIVELKKIGKNEFYVNSVEADLLLEIDYSLFKDIIEGSKPKMLLLGAYKNKDITS